MKNKWITWWSRAQRGMGMFKVIEDSNKISVLFDHIPQSLKAQIKFANFYSEYAMTFENIEVIFYKNDKPCGSQLLSNIILLPSELFIKEIDIPSSVIDGIEITYIIHPINTLHSGVPIKDLSYSKYKGTSILNQHQHVDQVLFGLIALDLFTDVYKGTIVAFGDSITEGEAWVPCLKEELLKHQYVLVNLGISGNRLLSDIKQVEMNGRLFTQLPLKYQCFGESGKSRAKRDIFIINENVSHVIIALGINDLYQPGSMFALSHELPTINQLIEGLEDIIKLCQQYQAKIILTTLTPFLNADGVDEEKEKTRVLLNEWIRMQKFPIFDLDKLWSDHGCLIQDYDSGDHLHPMKNALKNFMTHPILEKMIRELNE